MGLLQTHRHHLAISEGRGAPFSVIGDSHRCSGTRLLATPIGQPDRLLELAEKITTISSQLGEPNRDERRAISLLAFGCSYNEICDLTG
jgi:hypothetical protein